MHQTKKERISSLERRLSVVEQKIGTATTSDSSATANIEAARAANPQLGAVSTLPDFLATAGVLTSAQRRTIIDQALTLIDDLYVHLPLKRAMHAVDPVQRLKLLRRRVDAVSERRFHNEMIDIFKQLRDLHTNYVLPAPYNEHTAFLPFLLEEYFQNDERRYIVTRMLAGFDHATFAPGVEVTHWSGVPIDQAVATNAEREAGSNEAARHVRGLDAMTVRPMSQSLPPEAEWVIVGYVDNGSAFEIRLPWQVFRPDPADGTGRTDLSEIADEDAVAVGVDLDLELTNQARKLLFAPESRRLREEAVALDVRGANATAQMQAFKAEHSIFPEVFEFRDVDTPHGSFGYIRIRTFSLSPGQFLPELQRILGLVSQNGLIIDVRGNGGGYITSGERMLQLFSAEPVEAERLHFINTDLTQKIAESSALGGFANRWRGSIELSLLTAAVYSQGFPIESPGVTNAIGRTYNGNVVLITDARCYSTTDIFAAGFQDNEIGPILGVDHNTGAGGANVFSHDLLQTVLPGPNSPIQPLPHGANMRVAIRRTTRVRDNAGQPLEDLGVVPDMLHQLTRDDVMNGNPDLIEEAARILAQM